LSVLKSQGLVRVSSSGWISALGWKAYLSMALARQAVGLDIRHNEIRVWFFDVLLGAFDLGDATLAA